MFSLCRELVARDDHEREEDAERNGIRIERKADVEADGAEREWKRLSVLRYR